MENASKLCDKVYLQHQCEVEEKAGFIKENMERFFGNKGSGIQCSLWALCGPYDN
jgi:hypothetical protein